MPAAQAARASDAPRRVLGTRSRSGNAMARTRSALLAAAVGCVERYGVRRTTMGDVAAAGGVAKATLYNHFRTKGDLLLALVEDAAAALVADARTAAAVEGLPAALVGVAERLAAHPALRRVAVDEPGLLVALAVPGPGRSWTAVREGVAAVLSAGRVDAGPAGVELVLRWVLSQLLWPLEGEDARVGAGLVTRGLGVTESPVTDGPAATGPAPAAVPARTARPALAELGWPG